ncbi:MAG: GtrA family protein [Eubacteriales bacterium]|nr:GtrA family protein [Eubacteriales bacterium]
MEIKSKLKDQGYEALSYLVAGVLTTVVDYIVFILLNEYFKREAIFGESISVLIATATSWLAAVVFAYIVNKLFVFKNYNFKPGYLLKEGTAFFAARIISGIIVMAAMWIMVDMLAMNEYFSKIVTSVFNIGFNYVASKLYIFRKTK